MDDSLKEFYAKKKELKIKINTLLNEISKLFQENQRLRKENDDLKQNEFGFSYKDEDLKRNVGWEDKKIKV